MGKMILEKRWIKKEVADWRGISFEEGLLLPWRWRLILELGTNVLYYSNRLIKDGRILQIIIGQNCKSRVVIY